MESLKVFSDVMQTGSFSRAATLNHCTPAQATRSFQIVEAEFGVPCAIHDSRLFQSTTAGDMCHAGSLELLQLHAELSRKMQETRETSARVIHLAACYSFGLHQLQPILRQFRGARPDLKIHDRYAHIDRVHEWVRDNEVDLGVVAYPRRLPGLAVLPVRHEPLVLVTHPGHRLAARPGVPVTALRNERVIAWSEIKWATFLRKIPDSQRHLFEPHCEFNEIEKVKQAVEVDIGVAVLPAAAVAREVADGRLAAITFEDGKHTKPVAVIHRRGRKLTPIMQQFIEHLKQPGPEKI